MNGIAGGILEHKKAIIIIFIISIILCAVLTPMVGVNFNLSDYLPDSARSVVALKIIKNNFSDGIPNVNVFIPGVSIPEALKYKEKLAKIPGVSMVMWLDDVSDIAVPLEMQDKDTVEDWYKDGNALFKLLVDQENSASIVEEIRSVAGKNAALSGEAVNQAAAQTTTMGEISMIMLYTVPLVLVILLLSTSSWFEPVLFLLAIGVAIIFNEGTNIFLGEISYVTRATSAILQLAVSIDYAVFLLHSFSRYRQAGNDVKEAMQKAMVESSSAVAASAATTLFGFLALTLMKFKIGPDMGFVLAKGVLASYISVMVLLPVVTVYTTKIMDRTRHRPFMPSFKGFGKVAVRICTPLAFVVILLIIPSFQAQMNNEFLYGSSGMHSEDSEVKKEARLINGVFGELQQMVLLVPDKDIGVEKALTEKLYGINGITSVVSYANTAGVQVPPGFLDEDIVSRFHSNGYSRIFINSTGPDESAETFNMVEGIMDAAESYYGDSYYLTGQCVINYDLKKTITGDYLPVTLVSIIAIGMVLLITFRSVSIPLILLLTIEGAVWINLGLPYFAGDSLNYIGYQIISSVQLGATVDYGILFAEKYLEFRKTADKKEAARLAVARTAASILTPAGILTTAGFILGLVSTNGIISQLGTILGRGAAISAAMVLLFLPALLMFFDGVIRKTAIGRKE